jgi:tRNA threonylcarbamoyladenosine biosynthesis protein TsaE
MVTTEAVFNYVVTKESELSTIASAVRDLVIERLSPERGLTLILTGELGAGKTTFTKYFAQGCGIAAEEVSSPTYVLERQYRGKSFAISHWDLYRVKELPEELFEPASPEVVRFVEWGEKFDALEADAVMHFAVESEGGRKITLEFQ